MNPYITTGVVLAAILLAVRYMMKRARVDAIISDLDPKGNRKKQDAHIAEVAKLEQEILDAKIDYTRIRDRAGKQPDAGADE